MNFHLQVLVGVTLSYQFVCVQSDDDTLGPADITIERVEECFEPEKYSMPMSLIMKRFNRTHAAFNGCLDFPVALGPEVSLNLTAAKWGDGGWKPNAFNYANKDVCETLDTQVQDAWYAILRHFERNVMGCPLPEGKYCCNSMVLELSGLFPSMLYGTFRVDMATIWKSNPLLCIRAYIKSEPSKKKAR